MKTTVFFILWPWLLASGSPVSSGSPKAFIINECPYPLFVWSVSSTTSPRYRIAPDKGSYCEPLRRDAKSIGIALKVVRSSDPHALSSATNQQLILGYTLDTEQSPAELFFSLSNVFGTPFEGTRLTVASSDPACSDIQWPEGYNPGGGNFLRACSAKYDVTMRVCAGVGESEEDEESGGKKSAELDG